MEGAHADIRPAECRRGRKTRTAAARCAPVRGFHAVAGRPDADQATQPRSGEHGGRHEPQQVSLRNDRSRGGHRRIGEMGEALVGTIPARAGHKKGWRLTLVKPLLALLLSVLASGALAQAALYEGTDRLEKLVAGAKKEGELSMYTSAQADDIGAVAKAFEQKYGVKVNMWRAGSEKVLQRAVTEARGGRFTADIIETNGPEMEMLHREQLAQQVKSPHLADLIPAAIRPHGEWVGTRLNVFALAYNTRLVKKQDLPKSYEDLVHPRWKGK